jgi:hypothetical protein
MPIMSRWMQAALSGIAAMVFSMTANAGVAVSAVCHAASGPQRGALLELYTSEGCSSCPPADRWFAAQAAVADPVKLSLLAFHVDYWDSIGWPDRFGSAANSARQEMRVDQAGSDSVYTPQVMLGTHTGLPWQSPGRAMAVVKAVNAQASPLALSLTATPAAQHWRINLQADPVVHASASASIYLALYQDGLSTQVRAGENNGVTLHHERVVRALYGPWPFAAMRWMRDIEVAPPRDAQGGRLGLTAFVQANSTGEILQALSLPLAKCTK